MVLQCSIASGQRVWNRQPFGGVRGDGTSPGKGIRFVMIVGSGTGFAEIRACV